MSTKSSVGDFSSEHWKMADSEPVENNCAENKPQCAQEVTDTAKKRAEELKEKANDFFKSKIVFICDNSAV